MSIFNLLTSSTQTKIRDEIQNLLAADDPDIVSKIVGIIGTDSTMTDDFSPNDIENLSQLYVQTIYFGKPYIQCVIMNFMD